MKEKIIFMYSGQGSHYYQMGRDLFDTNATFKKHMVHADALYKSKMHSSLLDELYHEDHPKSMIFSNIIQTQPALLMVEHALTQVLVEQNIIPDIVLGSSMGELAAAVTAGLLDFETALDLSIEQAKIIESSPPAGMLAIVHEPSLYQIQSFLYEHCELAAINFPQHFVVTGSPEELNNIVMELNKRNIASVMLNVAQGFHSHWIDDSKKPFLDLQKNISLNPLKLEYFSSATAQFLTDFPPNHFWDVIRRPIMFEQSIKQLEKQAPLIYSPYALKVA